MSVQVPPRGRAYPTRTAPEWNPPTPYAWDTDGKPLVTARNHAALLEEMRASAYRVLPERRFDPARAPEGWSKAGKGPWPRQPEDALADGLLAHFQEWQTRLRAGDEKGAFMTAMWLWSVQDVPWVSRARPGAKPAKPEDYVRYALETYREELLGDAPEILRRQLAGDLAVRDYVTLALHRLSEDHDRGYAGLADVMKVHRRTVEKWSYGEEVPDEGRCLDLANHHAWFMLLHWLDAKLSEDAAGFRFDLEDEDVDAVRAIVQDGLKRPKEWTTKTLWPVLDALCGLFPDLEHTPDPARYVPDEENPGHYLRIDD